MEEDKKLHLKHIELYVIGFIIAIAVAVIAFTYGCKYSGALDPGYYEIEIVASEEVPGYAKDFTYVCYFDGSSREISDLQNTYKQLYCSELMNLYACLDDENEYTHYKSIAVINNHPNEEVEVSSLTYEVLTDAYQKTSENENYSVFAGPLYSFWEEQMSTVRKSEQIENDPINNIENATYLAKVATYVASKDHVDLKFLGNNKVKLVVSDEYVNYLKENKREASFVSLNILKNSYIIERLSDYLNTNNLDRGIVYTDDGLLSQHKRLDKAQNYAFYTLLKQEDKRYVTNIASITGYLPSSASCFRNFQVNSDYVNRYYDFEKDGVIYYRSLNINIKTGIPTNYLLSSSIYSKSVSLLSNSLINNELSRFSSIGEIRTYVNGKGYQDLMLVVDVNLDDNSLYITDGIKNNISLLKELEYNLIKI